MYYNIPTKLFCEPNCIINHSKEFSSLGTRALIVTGKHSSKANGSLNDVTNVLSKENIAYEIYDEVLENPSIENIMDAVSKHASFAPDFVIGIGGGSPLDASKAIALMLDNPDKTSEYLFEADSNISHLPVICIPTTCGTGSEVTPYSILTIHEKETKSSLPHKIWPAFALIDSKYLSSASETVINNTAIDALGHLIESYVNTRATVISRMFCDYSFSLWPQIFSVLDKKEKSESDYELLMIASSFAGMAISHTGTSLPHGMSYHVTYAHNVPHGKAVGAFLAAYLKYSDEETKSHILGLLKMNSTDELHQRICKLTGTISLSEDEIIKCVNEMMGNQKKLSSCPYKVDKNIIENIYNESII